MCKWLFVFLDGHFGQDYTFPRYGKYWAQFCMRWCCKDVGLHVVATINTIIYYLFYLTQTLPRGLICV